MLQSNLLSLTTITRYIHTTDIPSYFMRTAKLRNGEVPAWQAAGHSVTAMGVGGGRNLLHLGEKIRLDRTGFQ